MANEGKVKKTAQNKAMRAAAAKRKAASPGAVRRKAARKEKKAANRLLPASVKLHNTTPKGTVPGSVKRPKLQVKPETPKDEPLDPVPATLVAEPAASPEPAAV